MTWRGLSAVLLLGFVAGIHVSALDVAGRVDISVNGIAALVMLAVSLVLLVVALARRRVPARGAEGVQYFLVTGFVGVAAPMLVLLHAVPHLPVSALVPVAAIAPVTAVALPEIAGRATRGLVLAAAVVAAGCLLLLQTDRAAFPWALAALAASAGAGAIHQAVRETRPAGDRLQLVTGVAVAATVILTVAYMVEGNPIDLRGDWGAGAWLVPFLAALTLAGIGLCMALSGGGAWMPAVAAGIACGIGWQVGIEGQQPGALIFVASAILFAACIGVGSSGDRGQPRVGPSG